MGLIDFVFPKNCIGCGREGSYICNICASKERLMRGDCPYCEKASIDGFTHTKCRKVYGLDGLTSVWRYQGVIKKAILALKYKYATEIASELTERLILEIKKLYIPQGFVLIPIPIYWYRQNVRGFNQSEVLGELLASKLSLEFNSKILFRTKSTPPQAQLDVDDRKKNLKGVFLVDKSASPVSSVILFDDVFTTGSTLREACKTLKRAGVQKVWGLTVAR